MVIVAVVWARLVWFIDGCGFRRDVTHHGPDSMRLLVTLDQPRSREMKNGAQLAFFLQFRILACGIGSPTFVVGFPSVVKLPWKETP